RAGSKIRFGSPGVKRCGAILARVRERTSKIMKRLVQVAIVVIACVPVGTRALAPEQSRGDVHVTFARDVAPILYRACAPCHHDGGPGPFTLTRYDDARRRAGQIVKVTRDRVMPPWKPEPGPRFDGERRLTDSEIRTF